MISDAPLATEQFDSTLASTDPELAERIVRKWRAELGPALLGLLEDPDITDIYRNPHSETIWVKSLSRGTYATTHRMSVGRCLGLIGTVAGAFRSEVSDKHPRLSKVLPFNGSRFIATIPPLVPGPTWYIRKRIGRVMSLEEYRVDGILAPEKMEMIRRLIDDRCNIFVGGPMGSGKTTLSNAVLKEMVDRRGPNERYAILEDTPELMCTAPDRYEMLTNDEVGVSFNDLLMDSLRYGATSLSVGEVRAAAMTLLEAWTTGHRGGIATIHGGSPTEVMRRFEFLIRRDGYPVDRHAIREAVHAVIVIVPTRHGRIVRHVARVTGVTDLGYTFSEK